MKQVWKLLSYILVAAAASALTLSLTTLGKEEPYRKLEHLTWIIEERFVEDVDKARLEDAAADAMVASLGDRWSYYMTAEDYAAYEEQMKNAYVGVGMVVRRNEAGYVDILRVEKGGPAQEAGVQPGDVLVAVDGQDILNQEIEQTQNMVRGESGTTVSLTFRREDRELTVELERRLVEAQVAAGQMLEGNVGLVTIANFDSRCAQESIAAIESLLEQGAVALIFDVRNNPGGYKDELVKLLDYLLPEGDLFHSVLYNGSQTVDTSDAKHLDIPMAVLANGNSYSAAEFFTAALVEYEAAVFVGEPTTGKGRFQSAFVLSDGSAVNLSVGTYTTPKGVDLTDVGLTPDVPVPLEEETVMEIYYGLVPPEEDPQIQKALELLTQ